MERIDKLVGLLGSESEAARRGYPAACCANAPGWPARWCSTRRSSSATSRTPGSTRCRTSYLSQLLIDLNAPDRRDHADRHPQPRHRRDRARTTWACSSAASWSPSARRELLLTSDVPVVRQFLSGRRAGPIGMATEEKDEANPRPGTRATGRRRSRKSEPLPIVPQLEPSPPGLPPRQAVQRRRAAGCWGCGTNCPPPRGKPSGPGWRGSPGRPRGAGMSRADPGRHATPPSGRPRRPVPGSGARCARPVS